MSGKGQAPGGWVFVSMAFPRAEENYFRLLRIARVCPEIRPNVDREAMLKLAEAVLMVPYLAVWLAALPLFALAAVALVLTQAMPPVPDFTRRRALNSEAAEKALPLLEVKKRMGEA